MRSVVSAMSCNNDTYALAYCGTAILPLIQRCTVFGDTPKTSARGA